MSYYGAGDYYGAGGLWDAIRGGVGGFFSGGLFGAGRGIVKGLRTGGMRGTVRPATLVPTTVSAPTGLGRFSFPGVGTGAGAPTMGAEMGTGRKRYRRMQYTNQKALRRANRRVDGFVKEVKKSLKHTPYTLVRKGSQRKKGPQVIVETGAGSVNV